MTASFLTQSRVTSARSSYLTSMVNLSFFICPSQQPYKLSHILFFSFFHTNSRKRDNLNAEFKMNIARDDAFLLTNTGAALRFFPVDCLLFIYSIINISLDYLLLFSYSLILQSSVPIAQKVNLSFVRITFHVLTPFGCIPLFTSFNLLSHWTLLSFLTL